MNFSRRRKQSSSNNYGERKELPELRFGDQGSAVRLLQRILNVYSSQVVRVDGAFGTVTHILVKKFQDDKGLINNDGIVDTVTWECLIEVWLEKKEDRVEIVNPPDINISEPSVTSDQGNYLLKIKRQIPSEIVIAYATVSSLLDSWANSGLIVHWLILIIFSSLTPLYLRRIYKRKSIRELCVSTIAFFVLSFALGGSAFKNFQWYDQNLANAVAIIYSVTVPLIKE